MFLYIFILLIFYTNIKAVFNSFKFHCLYNRLMYQGVIAAFKTYLLPEMTFASAITTIKRQRKHIATILEGLQHQ